MRSKAIRLLLLIALVVLIPEARAQTAPQSSVLDDVVVQFQAEKGLDHLYNLEFEQAMRMFELIDRRFPEHPIGPFLEALTTWWQILLDLSNESHDAEFYAAMEEVIERSDRMLKRDRRSFDAMFFKGAALGFRGRLRSNRGDWLKAARDGLRAMDYVLAVAERAPDNPDYAFGKGIYDYYAAAVPEKYPYVKPVMIFFPDGNKQRGIQALQRTANHGRFIQTEAVYFLLQIQYLFEDNFEESRRHVTWLREQHPKNSFFHTFEGRVYAKWGHWDRAGKIFADVFENYKDRQTGYNAAIAEQALYFLARSEMAYGDYEPALTYLETLRNLAARDSEESYFEVLGRLREGMVYDAVGRRNQAVSAYQQVLAMEDRSGSHDRAKRYLDSPYRG